MRRWKSGARSWVGVICAAVSLAGAGVASAADFWSPVPAAFDPGNKFEARFGVFAHGVGSVEQGTADLSGSIASPRIPLGVNAPWNYLIPRIHAGGSWNVSGRTSFAYAGALWTIPVWDRFFVEGYVGPAVHDGSLTPTATHAGLGCPLLFHSGGSIGYQITPNLSIMGTFEHLSNGRTVFGIQCGTNQNAGGNQGLNNYGVRVGYSF